MPCHATPRHATPRPFALDDTRFHLFHSVSTDSTRSTSRQRKIPQRAYAVKARSRSLFSLRLCRSSSARPCQTAYGLVSYAHPPLGFFACHT
jgi:hypothetical protein